ncbi:MAG: hypothetical protein K9W43_07430 [Candidatus Thorarchaeota archaeon]|nr:hypothetical protein [Candidatus Thorarchaeota archaeon]
MNESRNEQTLARHPTGSPQVLVRFNWIFLVGSILIFLIVALPYLFSPYVYITHNPVDDALVAFLGGANVKPMLYLCAILGGLLGLIFYVPIHQLYSTVLRDQVVRLGVLRILLISFGSYLGFLWIIGLQAIWNYIIPYPNTGNLMALFFTLPGLSFSIVVSLINILEYHRINQLAKQNGFGLQITAIRFRNASQLELVPLHDASPLPSTSHSIDLS